MDLSKEFLDFIPKNDYLKQIIKELNTFIPSSLRDVFDFEKKLYENFYILFINDIIINSINNNRLIIIPIAVIQTLNSYIEKVLYERGFEYILFIQGNGYSHIESIKLQKNMIDDFCYMIDGENSIDENKKYLSSLKDMMKQNPNNFFLIVRRIYFSYIQGLKIICESDIYNVKNSNNKIEILNTLFKEFLEDKGIKYLYSPLVHGSNRDQEDYEYFLNLNMKNTEEFLRKKSVELKDSIRYITTKFNLSLGINFFSNMNEFFMQDIPRNDIEILSIIEFLKGSLNPKFIEYYNKNYTLKLDNKDLLFFNELKSIFSGVYNSTDRNCELIYYGVGERRLYLLAKHKIDSNELILIKLYDDSLETNLIPLISDDSKDLETLDMKIIYLNKKGGEETYNSKVLTEGISVDEDGIKFYFKPRKSYMDDYSENHKLLVENFKSKNYEAMKHNLAYLFALINSIERDVIYKKKNIDTDKLKDAQKARAFAINDFKTYLKEVQKNEKDFDFTKYFENGGYDTFVYNIDTKSILGVKKLFKIIMLG